MISNTPSKARSPRGKKRDEAAQREPEGIQANEWDDKHDGRGRRKSTKSVVAFKSNKGYVTTQARPARKIDLDQKRNATKELAGNSHSVEWCSMRGSTPCWASVSLPTVLQLKHHSFRGNYNNPSSCYPRHRVKRALAQLLPSGMKRPLQDSNAVWYRHHPATPKTRWRKTSPHQAIDIG